MRTRVRFLLLLVPLVLAGIACDKGGIEPAKAAESGDLRLKLNQGYSMLYFDVSHVEFTKLLLLIKVESDPVNTIVTEISDYSGELAQELKRLAKDYPALRIDLDPLPEMEKRKRADVSRERVLSFAPFVGRTGGDFERTLLLSLSAVLSQESHLCKVMADEEPDPGLRKFLLDSKQRFDGLYDRVVFLLNRDYFKGGVSPPERH